MAQFRGEVTGQRGAAASRLGNKSTGLMVEAQSWQGKICTRLWHDDASGLDMAEVTMEKHHGNGREEGRILYHGPVNQYLGTFVAADSVHATESFCATCGEQSGGAGSSMFGSVHMYGPRDHDYQHSPIRPVCAP